MKTKVISLYILIDVFKVQLDEQHSKCIDRWFVNTSYLNVIFHNNNGCFFNLVLGSNILICRRKGSNPKTRESFGSTLKCW